MFSVGLHVQSPSLKGLNYSERLKQLGLPTLEYRHERADVIEVYKIMNNIDLVNKDKLFEMATYHQTRGHPFKLFKKRARLNVRANSFNIRVIDNWNNLPSSVVLAPSVNAFKNRLNKYWQRYSIKFEASCYTPGPTARYWTQPTNASEQVIE